MAGISKVADAVTIRDAATVALLRDDLNEGLQVLLLRRHAGHVFGARADVFPGGAVDVEDFNLVRPGSGGQAQWPDAAWRMAAIRECFEEAGLLLADAEQSLASEMLDKWRRALNAERRTWPEFMAALTVQPDLSRLVEFAYWVTPSGPPKRYATRFYAARAPVDARVAPDGHEVISAEWVSPDRALAQARAGQRRLMVPTRATLEQLSVHAGTTQALQALAEAAHE